MKRLSPLTGFGALLATAPLWMGASDCEVAVVSHDDGCRYDGKHFDVGDSFPDTDGCNTCSCEDDGSVACTLRACADVCEYNGEVFMVGSSFPAGDGCNTCSCDADGSVGCTERGCMGGGGCDYNGQHYEVGESLPKRDCNFCSCGEDGEIECTDVPCPCEGSDCPVMSTCTMGTGSFAAGESVVCPDGCNDCGCGMDGGWSSTDAACPPLRGIELCDPMEPGTGAILETKSLYVEGSSIALDLTYSGGCEAHTFKLCWDGSFLESSPVQVAIRAVDISEVADPCEALPTESRVFSLEPLAQAYREAYQTMSGTIILNFEGGSERYEF